MLPIIDAITQENVRAKRVPKGQILFYQGDLPDRIYILEEGIVKLHDIDDGGSEKILHLLGPTAILPLAFFSGPNYATHWFYTTLTECLVVSMTATDLRLKMSNDGDLALLLVNWFSQELHEILVRLSSLGKSTTQEKIIAALKFLALKHAKDTRHGWCKVNFPVNHQLLADITGITRESVTMNMGMLMSRKIIKAPGHGVLYINHKKLSSE